MSDRNTGIMKLRSLVRRDNILTEIYDEIDKADSRQEREAHFTFTIDDIVTLDVLDYIFTMLSKNKALSKVEMTLVKEGKMNLLVRWKHNKAWKSWEAPQEAT